MGAAPRVSVWMRGLTPGSYFPPSIEEEVWSWKHLSEGNVSRYRQASWFMLLSEAEVGGLWAEDSLGYLVSHPKASVAVWMTGRLVWRCGGLAWQCGGPAWQCGGLAWQRGRTAWQLNQ